MTVKRKENSVDDKVLIKVAETFTIAIEEALIEKGLILGPILHNGKNGSTAGSPVHSLVGCHSHAARRGIFVVRKDKNIGEGGRL